MYTLYLKFVEQVKQQEISTYNERHRDYLIRAGKLQPQPRPKDTRTPHPRPKREQPTQNVQQAVRMVKPQVVSASASDQRPLKGSNGYNIPQEEQAYQAKPIKSAPIMQKAIQNIQQPKMKAEIRDLPTLELEHFEQPIKSNVAKVNQAIIPNNFKAESELPSEFEEIVLVECPEGCGKKFNERALEKHVRLCGKQVKRKVFHTKVVDEEALELKKDEKPQKKAPKAIPKWKMDSNKFRNAINQQKAIENGGPPPPSLPEVDERVECPGCGRKFNAEPAAKHIPICVKRNTNKR